MSEDEVAIRALLASWMKATEQGDMVTVLNLMSDDVVFTVPGLPPFGKAGFATGFMAMQAFKVSASCEPAEIEVLGNWAYVRNHIRVVMTPRIGGGSETKRSGYTMSILKKRSNGSWVVTRDANMLVPEP
jgi:uncharacterized protein (TIGR02246 family)